jgi:arsenate reductase
MTIDTGAKRHVLFLCTANSARSQMAEALLRKIAGDQFEVHSAGLEPKVVNPYAIEVMEEIGVNMSGHRSKSLSEFLGKVPIRTAIIVCANAESSCPKIWPFGATVLSWPFDDPAATQGSREEVLAAFRETRDSIEARIREWMAANWAT